jgi:hypothetical protein
MAERLADQARQQLGEFSATQSEGIWEQVNRTLHDHYAGLAESIQTSMNIGWGHGGKINAAIAEIGRFIEDSGPFISGQLKATAS